jgi:hypothetical protein
MVDPRRTSPMVLPNYPYKGKFTNDQVREALERKDRLVELLMDPVGPDGTLINIPVDMMHILAFHMAYAGADTHTDHRQLIESRTCRNESQMWEVYEWRPRGGFGDTPTAEPDTAAEAVTIASQMKTQLTPQVRAALAEILAAEFAATRDNITTRERAENVLTEQRMKGSQ